MPNDALLNEFYVVTAFKKEMATITEPNVHLLTIEMLRRADERFFTAPSSPSGKYHPPDEYFSGAKGDVSKAPIRGGKEYGGQVLHCRRVAKVARQLCKAHLWDEDSYEYQFAISASLCHDIGCYERGRVGRVPYHESVVRELTMAIPVLFPHLVTDWNELIRLCEVHSGRWGKDETYLPLTELEKLVHDADYLASRRFMTIDPEGLE